MIGSFTIENVMTPHPLTVACHESVAFAHRQMASRHVRHLPVMQGPLVVGVIGEREIAVVEGIKDLDADRVSVAEAMDTEPYRVAKDTPLVDVLAGMLERRADCVLVEDSTRIVGVFTHVDACRLLLSSLRSAAS